jgi:hypothetical protein
MQPGAGDADKRQGIGAFICRCGSNGRRWKRQRDYDCFRPAHSGTSLMMQTLAAGGMTALTDGARRADTDNPRGYSRWERIKQLPQDPNCIDEAERESGEKSSHGFGSCYSRSAVIEFFSKSVRSPKQWLRRARGLGDGVHPVRS